MKLVTFFKFLKSNYLRFKLGQSPQRNLFYGFLTYVFVGFILLSLPWLQKGDTSWIDNLFISASAVSTTGLVTISVFDSYNFFGQFVILVLFQLGGIGYLTFTTFMLLSTTRKLTRWHKRILNAEFTLPTTIKISDFLRSVIVFTALMEILGAIMFFIAFKLEGYPSGEAVWLAVFHSVSSFCTAGFSLFNNGFADFVDHGFINFIVSFLAIAGSLGFIVVTDFVLWFKNKSHSISFTTKIILSGFFVLLFGGSVLFYFFEPSLQNLQGQAKLYAAFFQAMTASTTVGFNTVDFGMFSLPMLLIAIFLMYVGASPSGTAGGMKITTLTAILSIMKSRLRGEKRVTFMGRVIPFERLYIATSSFIFYTSLIALGTFLMTFTEAFDFEQIMFEVASALGTVGLSTGITADLSVFGKMLLILLMFIGRLGVLTFGLAVWQREVSKADVPAEEDLAV